MGNSILFITDPFDSLKQEKDSENIFCRDNFERRLFYTAVTRAKKFLDIYYLN